MMKCVTAIIAALTVTLGTPQFASASQTLTSVKVGSIHMYADNHFDANFSAPICDDSGAMQIWGHTIVSTSPSVTADGIKAMLSVLLAAKLSGRTVQIYTNGTTGPGGMCFVIGVAIE